MKIYIISAALFFCTHALAMEHTNVLQKNTLGNHLPLITKASGFSESSYQKHLAIINSYNKTYFRNKKCTLRRLLSPCLYLQQNPLRAKL